MEAKRLMSVDVVTDDSTGIYEVGEFDFAVPYSTGSWLDREPGRRAAFAEYLRKLARMAERGEDPFRNKGEPNAT